MPALLYSAAVYGLEARPVTVEADLHRGLPKVTVVGLPDAAVQEARERIRSAIKNSGFDFPLCHVIINLSPADWRKEGSGFDVPAALAVLVASRQLPAVDNGVMFIGELNLNGTVRPTTGVLAMAALARRWGKKLAVPLANAAEASMVKGLRVIPLKTLAELTDIIQLNKSWPVFNAASPPPPPVRTWEYWPSIVGQAQAKRAMVIAAAGHHNCLLIGPPGSGKTLLAQSVAELLPPLTEPEALAATTIHSVAGQLPPGVGLLRDRPFRQPHHTASVASLVGGGRIPRPGELSLANHGVLFLDEFPEFSREHIEALRQPLEDGVVSVTRVAGAMKFPADCMMIAAMNPCPCGYLHDTRRPCTCQSSQVRRYQQRLSGPVLDRFDLFVSVPRVPSRELAQPPAVDDPRAVIAAARRRQAERYRDLTATNGRIRGARLKRLLFLEPAEKVFIEQAMEKWQLTMRAYHRVIRVARTIADLEDAKTVSVRHLAEALQFRPPANLANY